MTGFVGRHVIIALVALAIILPQASAALAGLGLADGRVVVICTGGGLRSLRINDDGEPVEISHETELCALVHAADTSTTFSAAATHYRLLYATGKPLAASVSLTAHSFSPSLPRGPPPG